MAWRSASIRQLHPAPSAVPRLNESPLITMTSLFPEPWNVMLCSRMRGAESPGRASRWATEGRW
eukprot:3619477-Pyramimonas_sp.AAC.1